MTMESLKSFMKRRKMRGNTAKGNAFEEEVAEELRKIGWIVDVTKLARRFVRTRTGVRWITEKGDYFEALDIIAIRKDAAPVLLIQATTDRGMLSEKKRKIDDKIGGWAPGRVCMVATRPISGAGIEFHQQIKDGWEALGGIEALDFS